MVKHPHLRGSPRCKFVFALVSVYFLAFGGSAAFAADRCVQGGKELVGSFDVIQTKGGLWGFMEKTPGLKEKSVLGLQTDGKMRRTITIFEDMCENGKKPGPELFHEIQSLIGDGRMIFNMNPDRTPPKKILERVQAINEKATALLAKLGE